MNELPRQRTGMPPALTIEREANNLASLTINQPLRDLMSVLVPQWKRRDLFSPLSKYGIGPLNRALFYGPPGNGKTVSAQLIAEKLGCPLLRVCCERLVDKWLGDTAKNITDVMNWLESEELSVVLFDEVEAIFPSRRGSDNSGGSREISTAMTVFWQRMDRWRTPQLFLLATNMVDRLDPALLSRIDLQIEFGPPTDSQAIMVIDYWTEMLHEYGSESWSVPMRQKVIDGHTPQSFRALWQGIAAAVRRHVLETSR